MDSHRAILMANGGALRACRPSVGRLKRGRTAVSYVYTDTPAERAAAVLLRLWRETASEGAQAAAPRAVWAGVDTVILQATGYGKEFGEVAAAMRALQATAAGRAVRVWVLTPTDVTPGSREAQPPERLAQYDARRKWQNDRLVRAEERLITRCAEAGIDVVPVSFGTIGGIDSGAVVHENKSSLAPASTKVYHFDDVGRDFIAQVLLNALRLGGLGAKQT